MKDRPLADRSTPDDQGDHWPRRAYGDDPLDLTSDDTFEDEATIPIKPRHQSRALTEDVEWPPRAPSAPGRDEPTEVPSSSQQPEVAPAPLGAHSATDESLDGELLTLDRPPAIAGPWVPRRQRDLDVDALVRRRRSWPSRVLVVLVLLGIAVAVGWLAFSLTAP